MIDVTILEAFTLKGCTLDNSKHASENESFSLGNIKKIFTNAVKSAIHRDSRLPIVLKLPYFITLIGLCEVLMHLCATKHVRDLLIYHPEKKCDLWRFITYMLLHNDHIHLALNIIIQFILATPLEFEQGHLRTLVVYMGGGLAGSLGASVFDNQFMLVGASAGIYALLISQISHILLNYNTIKYIIFRTLSVFLLALADILYICYHIYAFNNESPRIGLASHFAGAMAGLLLGAIFFNGTVKWKNYLHTVSAITALILHVSAILYNIMSVTECNS